MSKGLLKQAKELQVQSGLELAAAVKPEAPKQEKSVATAPKVAPPAAKPSVA
jgi:hypothetical protein